MWNTILLINKRLNQDFNERETKIQIIIERKKLNNVKFSVYFIDIQNSK